MKRNNTKIIAIVALFVAIIGLSVGFAAFSGSLSLDGTINISPDSKDFKVEFQNGYTVSPTGKATVSLSASGGVTVISGIMAQLTRPGDVVTIDIPMKNTGNYVAYLHKIEFQGPTGSADKCIATGSGTTKVTDSLLTAACDDITMKVSLPSAYEMEKLDNLTEDKDVTSFMHKLNKGSSENVRITITYGGTTATGNYVDGGVLVSLGSVKLTWKSTKNATNEPMA